MPAHPFKAILALLVAALLALGAAACGGDDESADIGGDAGTAQEETGGAVEQDPGADDAAGSAGDAEDPTTEAGTDADEATAQGSGATDIVGGFTSLELGQRVQSVFDTAGIEVRPTGAATREQGALRFPVQEGQLDVDTPSGRIDHAGGVAFTAAGQTVRAQNLVIDADTGTVTAEIGGRRVPLFMADFAEPEIPPTGDMIVWSAQAGLSDEAADAINQRLGVDVLSGGLSFGDLTVSAQRP